MTSFLQTTLDFGEAAAGVLPGVTTQTAANPSLGFGNFLSGLLSSIMILAALIVMVYLIWGAFSWINSGGDSGKIQKARDKMTQAVVGIIVLASTLAIMSALQTVLGISVFNFGTNSSSSSASPAISGNRGPRIGSTNERVPETQNQQNSSRNVLREIFDFFDF